MPVFLSWDDVEVNNQNVKELSFVPTFATTNETGILCEKGKYGTKSEILFEKSEKSNYGIKSDIFYEKGGYGRNLTFTVRIVNLEPNLTFCMRRVSVESNLVFYLITVSIESNQTFCVMIVCVEAFSVRRVIMEPGLFKKSE